MGKKIITTIMSSNTNVRERTKVLTQNTYLEQSRLKNVVLDYDSNKVNLRPDYQRDVRWPIIMYCEFIASIMMSALIPSIHLYKLQKDEISDESQYNYECLDGQHRLIAIIHYSKSRPVMIKDKKRMITWYHEASDTYVFYSKNDDTENWAVENSDKKVAYMTSDEQNDFDEFRVPINQILNKVPYDERCRMFRRLQESKPVRNSDYYKNDIDVPLISHIHKDMRFEPTYKKSISPRLTSNTFQNWVFCTVRMLMISIDGSENVDFWVKTTDTEVKRKLKQKVPKIMNITPQQIQSGEEILTRFIKFLDSLPSDTKFTPVQLLATYVYLQENDIGIHTKLKKRLTNWAGEGSKEKKRMWYQNVYIDKDTTIGISRQMQYFNESLEYLKSDSIVTEPLNVGKRKTFGKKKRKELWLREFGVSTVGECHTCKKKINKDEKWHAGHIVSHAEGGSDVDIKNFVVQCRDCNLRCGTKNVFEYERQNYIL